MRKIVRSLESHRAREVVTDAHTVFAPELVSSHARGVSLKRKVNQLVHGAQEVARILRRNIKLEKIGVDLRQRDI